MSDKTNQPRNIPNPEDGRQGDVYLYQVEALPPEAQETAPEGERMILAHGEATGHTHSIDSKHVKHFTVGNDRYVMTLETTALQHQEHGDIPMKQASVFKVLKQTEYVPGAVPRPVRD